MPVTLPKPTATTFIGRVTVDAKTTVEITITGSGLTYDPTGAILSGDVYDISIGRFKASGTVLTQLDTSCASGINMTAARLAEMFGTISWNDPKLIFSAYDKLAQLHQGVSNSYFSAQKSYTEGSAFSDELLGSKFNDRMSGNGGDDDLYGGVGNDSVFGGAGDDQMWGDAGNDLLIDTEGNNGLYGGLGADKLRGGAGADQINGGAGRDFIDAGGGGDTVWGGTEGDAFIFNVKASGSVKIADFSVRDDQLINLSYGSAKEAYKDFLEHAHQEGRHVVYDEGELHLVLRYVKLDQLTLNNFAEPGVALESGLY